MMALVLRAVGGFSQPVQHHQQRIARFVGSIVCLRCQKTVIHNKRIAASILLAQVTLLVWARVPRSHVEVSICLHARSAFAKTEGLAFLKVEVPCRREGNAYIK